MSLVEVEKEGGVARVWLARPESRNALSRAMVAALAERMEELGGDASVRAVVLGGRGKDFCAGADLNEMREAGQAPAEANVADAKELERAFRLVFECRKPVVARVAGAALGGGAGLLAACDIPIAAETATIGFTEVRLGLLPAMISPYVVRRIGERHARELFLTGERFDGRRAAAVGLVQECVADAELDAAIARKLEMLLQGGPNALAKVKELLRVVGDKPLDQARALTPLYISEARASAEGQEGVAAFFEKRKPAWR